MFQRCCYTRRAERCPFPTPICPYLPLSLQLAQPLQTQIFVSPSERKFEYEKVDESYSLCLAISYLGIPRSIRYPLPTNVGKEVYWCKTMSMPPSWNNIKLVVPYCERSSRLENSGTPVVATPVQCMHVI